MKQQNRRLTNPTAPITNQQLLVDSDVNTATAGTTSSGQMQQQQRLAVKGKLAQPSFPSSSNNAALLGKGGQVGKLDDLLNVASVSAPGDHHQKNDQEESSPKGSPRSDDKKKMGMKNKKGTVAPSAPRAHIRSQPSAFECQHASVTLCAHSTPSVYYKRVTCSVCKKPLITIEQREEPLFIEPPGGAAAGRNNNKNRQQRNMMGRGGGGGAMASRYGSDGEYEKVHDETWHRRVARNCTHPVEELKVGSRSEEASAWCGKCGAMRHPQRRTLRELDGAEEEEGEDEEEEQETA